MSSKSQQYSRLLAFSLPFPTYTGLSTALWANRYAGEWTDNQQLHTHLTHTRLLLHVVLGHVCMAHKSPGVVRSVQHYTTLKARH